MCPWRRCRLYSGRVRGVAIDRKGNASNQSETQVTVLAPVVSDSLSTFLPASSVLLADSKGTQELTLTLKDGQGQVVDVAESDIVVGAGEKTRLPAGASISAPKKSAPGIYKVIVTAGTRGEIVTLTPVVSGVTLSAARVNINDMTPAAEQSSSRAVELLSLANNVTGRQSGQHDADADVEKCGRQCVEWVDPQVVARTEGG